MIRVTKFVGTDVEWDQLGEEQKNMWAQLSAQQNEQWQQHCEQVDAKLQKELSLSPPPRIEPAPPPANTEAPELHAESGGVVAVEAAEAKPLQRTAAQDSAILCEIVKQGYDREALPRNPTGKPGVKAAIRSALLKNSLFVGVTVFDKAWVRLTDRADIAFKD